MTDENQIDAEVQNEAIEEPTEEVEAEAEATEDGEQEPSDSSPEKKESNGFQKRIDKATRKQRDAERDRDYWREQALKAEKPEPAPVKPETLEVKTLEDFDFDETKYQAYIFQTAQEQAVQAAKSALSEDKATNDAKSRQKAFESKEQKYSKTVDDYMEVTRNPDVMITKDMVDIAASSEDGPALLYYLAKNPDISDNIARLSPIDAAREMGRIEATKLSAEPKKQTKAPKPPPKIDGVNATTTIKADSPDSDKLSTEAWLKQRRKQIAKG